MVKKYQVYYINDWGNPVFLFFGTLEECQKFYDDHIDYCDSKDAMIDVVKSPTYRDHDFKKSADAFENWGRKNGFVY